MSAVNTKIYVKIKYGAVVAVHTNQNPDEIDLAVFDLDTLDDRANEELEVEWRNRTQDLNQIHKHPTLN